MEEKLRNYLRRKVANYIRPYYIKDKCQRCDCQENLVLHHDVQFAEIVKNALDRLGLEYETYKEEYTKDELELIKDVVIGVHVRSSYTTLCQECHKEIHNTSQKIKQFLYIKRDEVVIPDDDVIIYLTNKNKIYKTGLDKFKVQRRNGIGFKLGLDKEEYIVAMAYGRCNENISIISECGKIKNKFINDIPYYDDGYFIDDKYKCVSIINLNIFNDDDNIIFCSKYGMSKRIELEKIKSPLENRSVWLIACTLDVEDCIVEVIVTKGDSVILVSTKRGNTIRFREEDVRTMGRSAKGVSAISLSNNDEVVSVDCVDLCDSNDLSIITITENGFCKRTPLTEYKIQNRGGVGLVTHKVCEKSGYVISGRICSCNDIISVWSNKSIIFIEAFSIPITGRSAIGVSVIKMEKEDKVKGMEISLLKFD